MIAFQFFSGNNCGFVFRRTVNLSVPNFKTLKGLNVDFSFSKNLQ